MRVVKTLDEIAIDGYSKQKLYRRVVALEEAGLMEVKRGPANTLLLDPLQERVLQRLISLEKNCRRTGIAIEKLKYELAIAENEQLRAQLEVKSPWWRRVIGWWRRVRPWGKAGPSQRQAG